MCDSSARSASAPRKEGACVRPHEVTGRLLTSTEPHRAEDQWTNTVGRSHHLDLPGPPTTAPTAVALTTLSRASLTSVGGSFFAVTHRPRRSGANEPGRVLRWRRSAGATAMLRAREGQKRERKRRKGQARESPVRQADRSFHAVAFPPARLQPSGCAVCPHRLTRALLIAERVRPYLLGGTHALG